MTEIKESPDKQTVPKTEEGKLGILRRVYEPTREGVINDLEAAGLDRNTPEFKQAQIKTARRIQEEIDIGERDPDTRILNKRGLDRRLKNELPRALAAGANVIDVYFDINDLKIVNDKNKDHAAGDKVILDFVDSVRESTRGYDLFARIGGDEFRLVLFGTENNGLDIVWGNIKKSLKEKNITVSAGATAIDFEDPSISLKRADEAMYIAKDMSKTSKESEIFFVAT